MTEEQKIMLFNKPSDWSYIDWVNSNARYLLQKIPNRAVEWVCAGDMTGEEKAVYQTYKTTEGYLKVPNESKCGQLWWDGLSEDDKKTITEIPNFDANIFLECTGIDVEK